MSSVNSKEYLNTIVFTQLYGDTWSVATAGWLYGWTCHFLGDVEIQMMFMPKSEMNK
jgi:hypothetical protein